MQLTSPFQSNAGSPVPGVGYDSSPGVSPGEPPHPRDYMSILDMLQKVSHELCILCSNHAHDLPFQHVWGQHMVSLCLSLPRLLSLCSPWLFLLIHLICSHTGSMNTLSLCTGAVVQKPSLSCYHQNHTAVPLPSAYYSCSCCNSFKHI